MGQIMYFITKKYRIYLIYPWTLSHYFLIFSENFLISV